MTDPKPDFSVFCDGSYHPQGQIGVIAVLIVPAGEVPDPSAVRTKAFTSPSITHVELKAAIWGMECLLPNRGKAIHLFTDATAIEGLPARREKLEASGYLSGRTGKLLANAELYKKFFKIFDEVRPSLFWIKGHSPNETRSETQEIFRLVDQAARKTLRERISSF